MVVNLVVAWVVVKVALWVLTSACSMVGKMAALLVAGKVGLSAVALAGVRADLTAVAPVALTVDTWAAWWVAPRVGSMAA